MWELADATVKGITEVNAEIDKFCNSDLAKKWSDYASSLNLLHVLPYILVISAAFFAIGWWLHGACWCCCCCKRGQAGARSCLWIFPHILFWLIFIIINSIIVAVGLVVQTQLDSVSMDMLNGKPTVEAFIDHIQLVYPDFWNVVFGKMVDGLEGMWQAAIVFEVFCILIVTYGCCMCCFRPYSKDVPEDAAKVQPVKAAQYDEATQK